jgi:hypothetical protein
MRTGKIADPITVKGNRVSGLNRPLASMYFPSNATLPGSAQQPAKIDRCVPVPQTVQPETYRFADHNARER